MGRSGHRKREYGKVETAYKINSFDLMENNDYMLMCANNTDSALLEYCRTIDGIVLYHRSEPLQ